MLKQKLQQPLLLFNVFIFYAGATLMYIHSLSYFLNQIGAEYLPIQLIIMSFLLMLFSVFNIFVAPKVKANKLLIYQYTFFITAFIALLFSPLPESIFGFTYLTLVNFYLFSGDIGTFNFASSYLNTLQAKTFLPKNAGAIAIAVLFSSSIAGLYNSLTKLATVQVTTLTILALTIALPIIINLIYKPKRKSKAATKKPITIDQLKQAFHFITTKSPAYKALILVLVTLIGIKIFIEFKLNTIISQNFSGDQVNTTMGYIFMLQAVTVWLFSFFVAPRLVISIGLIKLMKIAPAAIIIPLLFSIVFNFHPIPIAILFVFLGLVYSLMPTYIKHILSIVPKHQSDTIFFLYRGVFFAIAFMLFSISLLLYTININLEALVNTAAILLISIILYYSAQTIGRYFIIELKANLFKENRYLQTQAIQVLAEKSSQNNTGEVQLRRLLGNTNMPPEIKRQVIVSLGVIGNHQTIIDLIDYFRSETNPKNRLYAMQAINMIIESGKQLNSLPITKHLLLKAYQNVLIKPNPQYLRIETIRSLQYFELKEIIDFLEHQLRKSDRSIKISILQTLGTFSDRGILYYLRPYLKSKDIQILGVAIAGLWQFPEMRIHIIPKLISLLLSTKPENIETALLTIKSINATWEQKYAEKQLSNTNPNIQQIARLTLLHLGNKQYIESVAKDLLNLHQSQNHQQLNYLLSEYSNLPEKIKAAFIRHIQQLEEKQSEAFYQIFKNSQYIFEYELSSLK